MKFNSIRSHILALHYLQIQHGASLNCHGYQALKPVPSLFGLHTHTSPSHQSTSTQSMSTSNSSQSRKRRIAVFGGGASGMFAATAAADYLQRYNIVGCDVTVFEGTSRTMSKVRISGGGRVSALQDLTTINCFNQFTYT